MNIFSLLRIMARLGLAVVVCCTLLFNASEANLIVDHKSLNTSYLSGAMSRNASGGITPNLSDARAVITTIGKILPHINGGGDIDRRLNEILPDNNRKYRIGDIYNLNIRDPQIQLQCEQKHPNRWRGMSDKNGIIHLYGDDIADSVKIRFSNKTYLSPLPNDAELINEQALWESQVLHTLFHESGHVLLRKNCSQFDTCTFPDYETGYRARKRNFQDEVYKAIVLKENDFTVLHEAFAVYCNYLCCKYIEKRPDFTLEKFIYDTIDDAKFQTSGRGSKVLYGISLNYMWKFIVSLDYRESTLDDGKPCKALFDAYQNNVEKRGDTAWAQKYDLNNMWLKQNSAQKIQKANPQSSQTAWIAYEALLVSQVKTYSSKLPRSCPMHIPESAH